MSILWIENIKKNNNKFLYFITNNNLAVEKLLFINIFL